MHHISSSSCNFVVVTFSGLKELLFFHENFEGDSSLKVSRHSSTEDGAMRRSATRVIKESLHETFFLVLSLPYTTVCVGGWVVALITGVSVCVFARVGGETDVPGDTHTYKMRASGGSQI